MANEIMRLVAIEHKDEKIQLEVHIHLSQEEIERIVAPAVLKSLSKQFCMASLPRNPFYVETPGSEHAV
jgi:hypothetical protein